jgi:hypothetical protein
VNRHPYRYETSRAVHIKTILLFDVDYRVEKREMSPRLKIETWGTERDQAVVNSRWV